MKVDPEKEVVTKICQRLIEEREAQGISQRKLSELTGLSPTGIRHIESMETSTTLFSLLKICKALGCDLSEALEAHGR